MPTAARNDPRLCEVLALVDATRQHLVHVTLGVTIGSRCKMNWQELRQAHPDRWLVIEATAAHSEQHRRVLDAIALVASTSDAKQAMKQYLELHRQRPDRELYVAHTSREALDIDERRWVGIRRP